ncbi:MAG: ABC transporter ATP-binding protein [Thermodesulfobacteriota bacterium]|nr:ABC transporter ATP-binding protein [Thermodesulfobacteriota bacterium]
MSHQPSASGQRPNIVPLIGLIRPIYRRYLPRLLFGFLALLGVDFLQLTIPRYLKKGVDTLAGGTATGHSLLVIGGYILLTAALIGMLRFCWRTLIIGFSRRLEKILRNRLFSHILEMDRPFFDRHTTGDIMAHATNDLSAVQMACGMGMVAAADALVMSTAALFFMAHISPTLTLIAIIPMPLLALCTWILSGRLHKRFDRVQEQFSLLTEFARNTMVSIRLIKGYTRERRQIKDFEALGGEYVASNLKVAVIQGLLFPVAALVGNIGMLLVLYFGGRLVINNSITLGDFVAFITYMYMLIWPMMAVGWVTNLAQRGLTSLARIYRLLTAEPLLAGAEKLDNEPQIQSFIFLCRNLNFTYPKGVAPALSGVNLEIKPGILGVAGRTGSGKSTLCRLLTRQYPVAEGMLFFAGLDVNSFTPAMIRKQISYVGQQPVLFSSSVSENISLANPDASPEEITAVARLAAIHDEIMEMPDGYKTTIGERGLRLSGGQKQRIAIARALLADRPILIIDDALSALDTQTEQQVFAGIRTRLQSKTVLIVSHRLKLLSGTDRVIVLDQGRIVDRGNHQQLLARNDFYQAMARKQQRKADA